ncbi:MAG: hypothetical protein ABI440_09220 [Casimicrobiaceae bacterium]
MRRVVFVVRCFVCIRIHLFGQPWLRSCITNFISQAIDPLRAISQLTGRALAYGGTVTMDADTITVPSCGGATTSTAAVPTLSGWAAAFIALSSLVAGFAAMRWRRR